MERTAGSEDSIAGRAGKMQEMGKLAAAGCAPANGVRVCLSDITNRQQVPLLRNSSNVSLDLQVDAPGCAPANGVRVCLSDITNRQQVPLLRNSSNVSLDLQVDAPNAHKEVSMLCKMLEERNKIIEVKSIQLQTLRISTQKLYTQNWQVAKANALMLKELNLAKDKLKSQDHEYGCLLAVLKAKISELEARATGNDDAPAKMDEGPSQSPELKSCKRVINLNRRCQPSNLSSIDLNTSVQEMPGAKQRGNKRQFDASVRPRKSRRLTSGQAELEELVESEDNTNIAPPQSLERKHGDDLSASDNSTTNAKEKLNWFPPLNCSNSEQPTTVPSAKSTANAVLLEEMPIETKKRLPRTRSSVSNLQKPEKDEAKVAEISDAKVAKINDCQHLSFETSSCHPKKDAKEVDVGRRRSYRAAAQKVASYREKRITMKERRV